MRAQSGVGFMSRLGAALAKTPPIIKFGLVGALGFLVDATTLTLLLNEFPKGVARFMAFAVAVTFTYALNRWFTFNARGQPGVLASYFKFIAANSGGGLLNLAVSTTLLKLSLPIVSHPFVAVAAGSASGMLVNYLLSSRFVFARNKEAMLDDQDSDQPPPDA